MKYSHKIWIVLIPVIALAWVASKARPETDAEGAMRVHEFGKLPVVFHGRVKPYDTLARNSLVILSDKQTFEVDGEKRPAIEWLLDTISDSPAMLTHRVFRITNLQLLEILGLERRKGFRYAYEEFGDRLQKFQEQYNQVRELHPSQRDAYASQVLEFAEKLSLFRNLGDSHLVPRIREDDAGFAQDMTNYGGFLRQIKSGSFLPHGVPPRNADEEWKPFLEAALIDKITERSREMGAELQADSTPHAAVGPMTRMLSARKSGNVTAFNTALGEYQNWLAANPPEDTSRLAYESFYNTFQPFYLALVLYVFAAVLSCFSWLFAGPVLRRSAFWLLIVSFGVHIFAITSRIIISGYPPVTNLYGSAIFIGAGCVGLGLLLERLYPLGMGNIVAAVTGFLTLLIAHFLSLDGDTLEMMQAVLDTKFWLATHVITVTLGYTATYFAGGLAILYLLRGIFTKTLTRQVATSLGKMIYGVIAFALLLSFVGTVLGGLWADDSWGRFWGWDPKENGALIIVLWNALVLHARWAGLVRTRGVAVLAVGGNIVTSWSWFGVNQLGVGMHSYGFIDSVAFWLILFVASQLAIIGLGLLPRSIWRSQKNAVAVPPAPPADAELPEPTEA